MRPILIIPSPSFIVLVTHVVYVSVMYIKCFNFLLNISALLLLSYLFLYLEFLGHLDFCDLVRSRLLIHLIGIA